MKRREAKARKTDDSMRYWREPLKVHLKYYEHARYPMGFWSGRLMELFSRGCAGGEVFVRLRS